MAYFLYLNKHKTKQVEYLETKWSIWYIQSMDTNVKQYASSFKLLAR